MTTWSKHVWENCRHDGIPSQCDRCAQAEMDKLAALVIIFSRAVGAAARPGADAGEVFSALGVFAPLADYVAASYPQLAKNPIQALILINHNGIKVTHHSDTHCTIGESDDAVPHEKSDATIEKLHDAERTAGGNS